MRRAVVSWSLAAGSLVPATAALAQRIPATISSVRDWTDSRQGRREQASEWLKEVVEIERQIPTLSPEEVAWLKVEYDDELRRNGGSFTPRAGRASQSKEFAAREARPQAEELVRILRALASSSALAEHQEVSLWTDLASRVLFLNFWNEITTLGDAGIIARTPGAGPFDGYQAALYRTWAGRVEAITGRIILPYLNRIGRR